MSAEHARTPCQRSNCFLGLTALCTPSSNRPSLRGRSARETLSQFGHVEPIVTILASSLDLANADYTWRQRRHLPRHRPGAVLPGRHHRLRAACRSTRPSRCARECPVQRRLPRVRPRDQPGLGHLGRHLAKKSVGRSVASSAPARRQGRRLTLARQVSGRQTGTVRSTTVPAPFG